jgi:hypothetical protein
VCRDAHALVVLFGTGHEIEALPVFRSCLEHTLYLKALIDHGEPAVEAAYASARSNWRNFTTDAGRGPMAGAPGLEAEDADTSDLDGAWTQGVQSICGRYSALGTLYPIYRLACMYVHPSTGSALQYVDTGRQEYSPDIFRRDPDEFRLGHHIIFWTAVLLTWATEDFTSLLVQPDVIEIIQRAKQELGIVAIEELATSPNFGAVDLTHDRLQSLLFGEPEPPAEA